MVHCVPFRGYANHCFFAYHPDLFEALARANGYELLGIWLTFGDSQGHLIPWNDRLLSDLTIGHNTNVLLSVVLRRQYAQEFQIPFQTIYEQENVDENAARYQYVVDGELLDGRSVKRIAVRARLWPLSESMAPRPADPPEEVAGASLRTVAAAKIKEAARRILDSIPGAMPLTRRLVRRFRETSLTKT